MTRKLIITCKVKDKKLEICYEFKPNLNTTKPSKEERILLRIFSDVMNNSRKWRE